MNIKERLAGLITHTAQPVPFLPIAPEHVKPRDEPLVAEVNRHYFRIWLSEVSLSYDRKWFQKYSPAVSSLVRCSFDGQTIEIPALAGEFTLAQVNAAELTQAVRLNYPLTSLIPLSGDSVEVLAVLLAMRGENALASFFTVMSDFSELLAVPQISSALQVAGKLAVGINELLNIGSEQSLLGVHQTFTDKEGINPLTSGYLLVPLTSEASIVHERLLVVEGRLRTGADLTRNEAVTAYPYMLLRIEVRAQRDNWTEFKHIWTPLQEAIRALGRGERGQEDAETYVRTAISEALRTPDFVLYDRNRVARKVQAWYEEAKNDLGPGAIGFAPASLDDVMSLFVPETQIPRNRLLSFREIFSQA